MGETRDTTVLRSPRGSWRRRFELQPVCLHRVKNEDTANLIFRASGSWAGASSCCTENLEKGENEGSHITRKFPTGARHLDSLWKMILLSPGVWG